MLTTGKSKQVINEVIQEMEKLNNDTGLRINVHKIKYMNTSTYKHKNMQLKFQNINHNAQQGV
jgi:hypothetical protein